MDEIAAAMEAVPRAGFLPPGDQERADHDGPIAIGHGQTNSQPRTVADMLRLLHVEHGQNVLDVGSGSGWTTALLAHLVGPDGQVVGVELVPHLVEFGRANLAARHQPWARIESAIPDVLGAPDNAPYHRILVSAMATELPRELLDQLAVGGRMVLPIDGRMTLVEKGAEETRVTGHGLYRFVPLR